MSEYYDKHAPKGMKERVDRILRDDAKGKIDASDVKLPEREDMGKNVMNVTPKRNYKRGGKVEGEKAHHHAGRKSRDAGGQAKKPGVTPDELRAQYAKGKAEWDKKTPEQQQTETKAWLNKVQKPSIVDTRGDWKRGGRAHRDNGGNIVNQLRPQVPTSGLYGNGFSPTHSGVLAQGAGLKKGGEAKRAARAEGGRTKGKTNINIIIGAPKDAQQPPVPPPPSAMPPGAPPPPQPGLPPAAMGAMGAMRPPAPAGAAGPGMPPPPMPRARGGRAYPIDVASGGGEGRLEKAKAYGPK